MLTIKAEVTPGDEIEATFKEAIALANKLGCFIQFNFNGVTCIANPGGSPEKGADGYHDALSNDRQYKFAIS